ncbi:MAG: hypothetical protein AAF211_28670, partial [Myxococcota bacterium]
MTVSPSIVPMKARPCSEPIIINALTFGLSHWMRPSSRATLNLWASGCDVRQVMTQFDVPPPVRGLQALTHWFSVARD